MVTISYRGAGVHVVVMLIGDFCKIPKEEKIHIGYEACLYLVSIFVDSLFFSYNFPQFCFQSEA